MNNHRRERRGPFSRREIRARELNFCRFRVKGAIAGLQGVCYNSDITDEVRTSLRQAIYFLDKASDLWPRHIKED